MEKTLIQLIKAVASKLHESKLKRLGGKEMLLSLNSLKELLGLDNKEEVIIFTALFDRTAAGEVVILMILRRTLIVHCWILWSMFRLLNHY